METQLTQYQTLVQRASQLRLQAFSIAEGFRSGGFHSLFKGHGIEFTGVREYLRGDDIRTIDWNVTARMSKPYAKLFEEDRELVVFLVLDRSLSMNTGFGGQTRLECANEIAALLSFAAEHISSPLGAVFFDGSITFSIAPKASQNNVMLILSQIDESTKQIYAKNAGTEGSMLSGALDGACRLLKNRSLVVVVSDFRTSGYQKAMARLASKHDVLAIKIADPTDSALPQIGSFSFEDPETKAVRTFPTGSSSFRHVWKQAEIERRERWVKLCRRCGARTLVVSTDDEPAKKLKEFFASKENFV
ncbi:MAG: DUF58 domain-containing protein [Spirochaetaceae bacterium]|nr:DUF58 domain-containing protein [Spirochaetaceae bacterium]